MARTEIIQGDVNDIAVKPTWGRVEKAGVEENYEETYLSLAFSLTRLLDNKIDNNEFGNLFKQYGLVYYNNMLYIDPEPLQSDYGS